MKPEIHYRHYYNRQATRPKGALTVAYTIDKINKIMKIGISFCSPKDVFCKKIGRVGGRDCEGAENRLRETPLIIDLLYLGDKPLVKRTLGELINWLFISVNGGVYKPLVKFKNQPPWFAAFPEEEQPEDWWAWK
jgi:hypothetical protein